MEATVRAGGEDGLPERFFHPLRRRRRRDGRPAQAAHRRPSPAHLLDGVRRPGLLQGQLPLLFILFKMLDIFTEFDQLLLLRLLSGLRPG